jgi:hypothetical protein
MTTKNKQQLNGSTKNKHSQSASPKPKHVSPKPKLEPQPQRLAPELETKTMTEENQAKIVEMAHVSNAIVGRAIDEIMREVGLSQGDGNRQTRLMLFMLATHEAVQAGIDYGILRAVWKQQTEIVSIGRD